MNDGYDRYGIDGTGTFSGDLWPGGWSGSPVRGIFAGL